MSIAPTRPNRLAPDPVVGGDKRVACATQGPGGMASDPRNNLVHSPPPMHAVTEGAPQTAPSSCGEPPADATPTLAPPAEAPSKSAPSPPSACAPACAISWGYGLEKSVFVQYLMSKNMSLYDVKHDKNVCTARTWTIPQVFNGALI